MKSSPDISWNEKGELKYKGETVQGSNVVDLVNDVLHKRKYFKVGKHSERPYEKQMFHKIWLVTRTAGDSSLRQYLVDGLVVWATCCLARRSSPNMFYLTLPSKSSMNYFPNNTLTHYTTKLPKIMDLNGTWEIGLAEIQYPHSWYNVKNKEAWLKVHFYKDSRNLWTVMRAGGLAP